MQTGALLNLAAESYTFTAESMNHNDRLVLHFVEVTALNKTIVDTSTAKIYALGQTVYVKLNTLPSSNSQVEVYNALGQQVYAANSRLKPYQL